MPRCFGNSCSGEKRRPRRRRTIGTRAAGNTEHVRKRSKRSNALQWRRLHYERGDAPDSQECGLERDQARNNQEGASVRSKKNGSGHFDVSALYSALDSERMGQNLNWKEVSAKSGVSASTLTRLSQGRRPDVDSLAALTTWLGIPADRFMVPRPQLCGAISPLTQISIIIRDDPNLNPDAAAALEELVKATYARLRVQREK
jgi:transcriptional regulator with XRE-family HTH domain